MAAARPLVTIQNPDAGEGEPTQTALPSVFVAPIRPDVVEFVFSNVSKNKRQPYAVSAKAGHQTSAESWGTGRAVSRIPRVPGGGTHRAGQGAFGNMCRGGRMFSPTKIWRRWHRKVNLNQRRYATVSALAASAVPSLVLARGHRIENIPEVPLVLNDETESLEKTSSALKLLKKIGAYDDVKRVIDTKHVRAGKGKSRNRRYSTRKGPLVIYGTEGSKVARAFRNIPGVEVCSVNRLNVLQLAPGGHLGRFIIWTKSAFEKLDSIFGTFDKPSEVKKGYKLPRPLLANSDLSRIINSDEIQSVIKAPKVVRELPKFKKNPLKNSEAMFSLNPYAREVKRKLAAANLKQNEQRTKRIALKKKDPELAEANKAWYKTMVSDSDYTEFENFSKWLGVTQ